MFVCDQHGLNDLFMDSLIAFFISCRIPFERTLHLPVTSWIKKAFRFRISRRRSAGRALQRTKTNDWWFRSPFVENLWSRTSSFIRSAHARRSSENGRQSFCDMIQLELSLLWISIHRSFYHPILLALPKQVLRFVFYRYSSGGTSRSMARRLSNKSRSTTSRRYWAVWAAARTRAPPEPPQNRPPPTQTATTTHNNSNSQCQVRAGAIFAKSR